MNSDMRYPVDVIPASCGFIIFCRDIPEAQGHGETSECALQNCRETLIAVLDDRFTAREAIPLPGDVDGHFIDVPLSIAAKVLLLNEVVEQGVSNSELAKRIGLPRQEITRILNLNHTTKIDTIQKAMSALGKTLMLRVC